MQLETECLNYKTFWQQKFELTRLHLYASLIFVYKSISPVKHLGDYATPLTMYVNWSVCQWQTHQLISIKDKRVWCISLGRTYFSPLWNLRIEKNSLLLNFRQIFLFLKSCFLKRWCDVFYDVLASTKRC